MKLRYGLIGILFIFVLSLTAFQIRLVNAVSNANGPITGPITPPIPSPTPTPITPPTPTGHPLACGVYGDINQNKVISQTDVRQLLRYIVDLRRLSKEKKIAADVNKDGKINIADVVLIMQYVAGKINTFPACAKPTPTPTQIPTKTPTPTPIANTPTPTYIPTPTPTIAAENCKVFTYQDKFYYGLGKHCLDKITIQGIYFIAKNQTTGIKSYWGNNMLDIFTQIKNFYESQFENKIQITISAPIIIYGDKNIEEYDQSSIEQEIRQKFQVDTTNSFMILMFYPVQGENDKRVIGVWGSGGEVGNSSSAMNSWFWLDSERLGTVTTKIGTDYSGYLGSAHEFGHALGIPHPWQEEANKDSKNNIINQDYGNDEIGSLMSYSGQKGPLIPNSFIRSQVKQKMIVAK